MTPRRTHVFGLSLLLSALLTAACSPEMDDGPAVSGAPFRGPSFQIVPEATPTPPPPPPFKHPEIDLPPSVVPSAPGDEFLDDESARRRRVWLNEPLRCKAISSTKLRRCRFEAHEGGHRLKFQMSDVVCDDVEFDASGNPSRLTGCRGAWLRIPRNNKLKKARGQDVWSGSHRGWKWKDGSRYCCPGMWLEPPVSISR